MEAETFKKVFLPYHPKLYRVAFRIVQDKTEVEDIVQETYIKLWNKRFELEHIENTEAFAIVTLKNTCLDWLRKAKLEYKSYDTEISDTTSNNPIKQAEENSDLAIVTCLIEQLPAQHRQIIKLKHWEGCPDHEIEQITGLSAVNIRVILSRTRKMIREQFAKIEQR